MSTYARTPLPSSRRSAYAAGFVLGATLALAACGPSDPTADAQAAAEPAPAVAEAAASPEDAARIAALNARLDALETETRRSEDVSAIKRLMRTYSYYLDRGLWADMTELFTDDAVGVYPAGTFIGKDSLAPHFLENNGRGYIGFEEGRLGNHMVLQPVIDVDPDGVTAHGRWRVLAQLGQYGQSANWAGGVYEIGYAKQEGVWKISALRYYGSFGGSYATGWAGAPPPADGEAASPPPQRRIFANLPHPPDEPAPTDCPSFPGVCVPPFHYDNPVSGRKFDPDEWMEGGDDDE